MARDPFRGTGGNVRWSREYQQFKESETEIPTTLYERLTEKAWNIYQIRLGSIPLLSRYKDSYQEHFEVARMDIEADQIGSLLVLPLLFFAPLTILATFLGGAATLFSLILPGFWIYWSLSYPSFRSTVVRIKSSDEALRVILYMAMQLEMNPNLSGAVKSAAGHTDGYLSKDLARVMWKTETGQKRVQNIQQAISSRVDLWRKWSTDFVKSLEYLIDSLSRRGDERRRMIQKGQEQIIGAMENKMDQYARNLNSPIRVLNMAGIMLPLMGLIMFPLISIFLGGNKAGVGSLGLYMAAVYLFILPLFLFFLVKRLISKRPGAYSKPSLENVDDLPPKNKVKITAFGDTYSLPLKPLAFAVGLTIALPGIIYYFNLLNTIISYETVISLTPGGGSVQSAQGWSNFIEQQYAVKNAVPNVVQGLTLFIGINAGLITYFLGRSYGRRKIRAKIERIESDIEVGLTELENALSKDMPIERAVYVVSQKFEEIGEQDQPLKHFFDNLFNNMQQKGFPFNRAIFDDREGAINSYPSNILRNSMQMLSDSTSKGPRIAAKNLRRVNEYITNQKEVEETIRRLLDDVVSQMEIQAKFIAPVITGMAAAMSLLIIEVLSVIAKRLEQIQESLMVGGGGSDISSQIALLKNIDSALPPTLILLIVSLYLVEVSLILAYFVNGIENGFDEISRDIKISKTLIYSTTIFTVITLISALYILPMIPQLVGL